MNVNIIETSGLGKRYGSTWALRGARWRSPRARDRAGRPERRRQDHAAEPAVGLAEPTAAPSPCSEAWPGSPAALDGIAFVAQDTPLYKTVGRRHAAPDPQPEPAFRPALR